MEFDQNDDITKRAQAIFSEVASVEFHASPFLATRVLALSQKDLSRKKALRFWKALALACGAVMIILIVMPLLHKGQLVPAAPINAAVAVNVEVQELDNTKIASAEIALPDGLYFYSETMSDIHERRKIHLAWKNGFNKKHLPIVVKADTPGVKIIIIKFFDSNHSLIAEKPVKVRFERRS